MSSDNLLDLEGTTVEAEALKIGDAVLESTKNSLGARWDKLTKQNKQDIVDAAQGLALEEAKSAAGLEFDQDLVDAYSVAIANWTMAGAIYVKQSFAEALEVGAHMAGKVLAIFAKALLKSLTGIG